MDQPEQEQEEIKEAIGSGSIEQAVRENASITSSLI